MSLSATGYAQHRKRLGLRGTSHVAVLKAIETGRLSPPAVVRQGSQWVIDPVIADQQWADRTTPDAVGATPMAPEAIAPPAAAALPPQPQPQPATPPPPPADPPPPRPQAPPRAARVKVQNLAAAVPPLATSKAIQAAYDAKLRQLEYQRVAEELVPARQVKDQAFNLGRALRDSLMRLADRLAPTLAATADARQVHHLLTEEIRVALRSLDDA